MKLIEILEDDIVKLIERDQEHLIPSTLTVDKEMFQAFYDDSRSKDKCWINAWGPGYYYLELAGQTIRVQLEEESTVH